MPGRYAKVIVVGLDGFEPRIAEELMREGSLPNLAALAGRGFYDRIRTTYSAQTPVAWSTFATGTNPGGHGIYDFVHRDPKTYLPTLSLNRYAQKNAFTPPVAVNMRGGITLWELLSSAGVMSTVIRCPCTFPPDDIQGRMLSGLGVPDLRGGLGTSTFYTSDAVSLAGESERVVSVLVDSDNLIRTHLIGPRNPKTRGDFQHPITIELATSRRTAVLRSDGDPASLEITEGQWSGWLRVKFRTGPLMGVRGMVRFFLVQAGPSFRLLASPVNFDPESPLFPISSPAKYAGEMASELGLFYTSGMVEEHSALNNGRIDEAAFLAQCDLVMRERERMLMLELARFRQGLLYCLFDTPDRLQHVFWRFREPDHPANWASAWPEDARARALLVDAIHDHYVACDSMLGRAQDAVDDRTLLIVLSDHGMSSFQRGLNVNTWLYESGFLSLKPGIRPGDGTAEFFQGVDWSRTQAYSLGLASIYLNLRGREGEGIVAPSEAESVKQAIAARLTALRDESRARCPVRSVVAREEVYRGPYAAESPDLVVNFAEGYRASWGTPLGGVPTGLFEDNTRRWSGDHGVDPLLVPGVCFISAGVNRSAPSLVDVAPTVLDALGVPKGRAMEGRSLLA